MAAKKLATNKKIALHPQITLYIISFILLGITVLLLALLWNKIPPEIPLFYGKPPGAKQIASKNLLFLPLGLAFFISIINYFIADFLKDQYLRYILAILSFFLSLISIITVIKIIFVVGDL